MPMVYLHEHRNFGVFRGLRGATAGPGRWRAYVRANDQLPEQRK